MNKQELIDKIAKNSGLTKADSNKALSSAIDAITDALSNGDNVQLIGFGSFDVQHRPARTGRNPRDGSTINIKASKVPRFRAGKALKEKVNR